MTNNEEIAKALLGVYKAVGHAGIGQNVVEGTPGTIDYWLKGAIFALCPEILSKEPPEWYTKRHETI